MRISDTQIQQVNSRISALIAADNFYGKKLKAAGISSISTARRESTQVLLMVLRKDMPNPRSWEW